VRTYKAPSPTARTSVPCCLLGKMSDYGDDYSDYGDEWLYVEEEYVGADDLAEHAVPSPPPTVYDEDALLDWDRFDYYNDLEYASDGYDNASFKPNTGTGAEKIGQKRKRSATATRERKRRRVTDSRTAGQDDSATLSNSPVVWRSHSSRGLKPRMLTENAEPFALLKNWRETAVGAPEWAQPPSQSTTPVSLSAERGKAHAVFVSEAMSPASEADVEYEEDEEVEEDEGGVELDPTALMAVLQERLAAAGGPLSSMDPEQLLQFAMRMATDKDAGDDIAGEMAEEMLGIGDEEEGEGDEEVEEKLLSWIAQQRDTSKHPPDGNSTANAPTPKSPNERRDSQRPPTPPSSEANRSICISDGVMKDVGPSTDDAKAPMKSRTLEVKQVAHKRKATDAADADAPTVTTKRRATKSFDAPTASSQARTNVPKTTRSGRVKR
jgi:hypothetical protein